jgi:predicted dehydrogenase
MPEIIRVGVVGAGANTRLRHIPGLQRIDGVQVGGVSNRSRESGERVAREFSIPKVYGDWRELVEDPEIHAVCIGTWPYLHCPVTLAALEAGKHVLCEARMAMNALEARTMLEASLRNPALVAQVVPAPFTFRVDRTIQDLLAEGFLGDLLAIDLRLTDSAFVDRTGPLTWRRDRDLSGFNTMMMGIWYECLMRWVGEAARVMAMTRVTVPRRQDAEGRLRAVSIPDHVDVLCEMACGAQAHLQFSAVTGLAPPGEIWLFGTEGTLALNTAMELRGGRRAGTALSPIEVPPEKQGRWRVEEEFINAIRGLEPVRLTDFVTGVKYMEWTEAVIRSAQSGRAISLPL